MSLQNKTLFISGGSRGIGLAIALRAARDGVNVVIAAIRLVVDAEGIAKSRKQEIMADAAWHILTRSSRDTSGQHFIDEQVLAAAGVTDLRPYRATEGDTPLQTDLFVPADAVTPHGVLV